jgi:hypothetical protein
MRACVSVLISTRVCVCPGACARGRRGRGVVGVRGQRPSCENSAWRRRNRAAAARCTTAGRHCCATYNMRRTRNMTRGIKCTRRHAAHGRTPRHVRGKAWPVRAVLVQRVRDVRVLVSIDGQDAVSAAQLNARYVGVLPGEWRWRALVEHLRPLHVRASATSALGHT